MTKEQYQEQLRDNRWSVKRKKILARDLCKCKKCGSIEQLSVHHLYYVEGNKAWEYPNDALVTWCNDCHGKWHETHEIVVRKKTYSKGKKKVYTPPKKQPHSKKNRLLRMCVKSLVPKKDYRDVWDRIRKTPKEDVPVCLEQLRKRYTTSY